MFTAKGKTISRKTKTTTTTTAKKSPSRRKGNASLKVLTADNLAKVPWLVHGFSTRNGGFSKPYGGAALNLGITKEDTREAVERNREAFLKKLGAPEWPIVHMHQVHSDVIYPITAFPERTTDNDGKPLLVGDGLVTDIPGVLLAVKTADCMPVMIIDRKKRAVGVFHAGWRGTLRRIAEKGVGEMRRWFNSKPEDLHAALGPSIRNCCYSVGEEVRDKFQSQFAYADELFREWQTYEDIHLKYPLLFLTMRAPGHSELPYRIFLDLAEANRRQLLAVGLRDKNIAVLPGCTSCDTKQFFSHRKEKGVTGRMMAVVGIRR